MRESRLITLLQLQKPEGLQALISTYQAYVGTIIRNITRSSLSEQDVEELTADTFLLSGKQRTSCKSEKYVLT